MQTNIPTGVRLAIEEGCQRASMEDSLHLRGSS